MIFGHCPHCGESFTTLVPDWDGEIKAERITCESCGQWFWEVLSRADPRAYLPDELEVDEETKTLRIRPRADK